MYTSASGGAPGVVTTVGAPAGWYSPCFSNAQRKTLPRVPPGTPSGDVLATSACWRAVTYVRGSMLETIGLGPSLVSAWILRKQMWRDASRRVGASTAPPPALEYTLIMQVDRICSEL